MEAPDRNAFVSYARTDADFALQLARDLKSAGVAAWIDQIDISAGGPVTAAAKLETGLMRHLCLGALIVVAVSVVGIYGFFARQLSESHMVSLSYFWVPLAAFGASGLTLTRGSLAKSLATGALTVPLLATFFSSDIPKL